MCQSSVLKYLWYCSLQTAAGINHFMKAVHHVGIKCQFWPILWFVVRQMRADGGESDNNTTLEQFLFRCHQTTQVLSTHKILFNSNTFENIVRGSVILF